MFVDLDRSVGGKGEKHGIYAASFRHLLERTFQTARYGASSDHGAARHQIERGPHTVERFNAGLSPQKARRLSTHAQAHSGPPGADNKQERCDKYRGLAQSLVRANWQEEHEAAI